MTMKILNLALAVVFAASLTSIASAQMGPRHQSPQETHSSPQAPTRNGGGFGQSLRESRPAAPTAAPQNQRFFFGASSRSQAPSRPVEATIARPQPTFSDASHGSDNRAADRPAPVTNGNGFFGYQQATQSRGRGGGHVAQTPPAPTHQPSNYGGHDRGNGGSQHAGNPGSHSGGWQHGNSGPSDNGWQHGDSGSAHVNRFFGSRGDDDQWREDYHPRRDRNLFFGAYLTTPFVEESVVSPWYYYPTVPGYLPENCVRIGNGISIAWNSGSVYEYGNYELDNALSALRASYLNEDSNAAMDLVSPNQAVAVFNEGQYMYTLSGTDFAQMFEDTVLNTQSSGFQITSVRTIGLAVNVDAVNTFEDGDGNVETVYQAYRLQNAGGRYVITAFMTSHDPIY